MSAIDRSNGGCGHARAFSPAAVEALGGRVLLSAAVEAGTLTLTGSAGDDVIVVSPGTRFGEVVVSGVRKVKDGTRFRGIREISINGGSGNDRIEVSGLIQASSDTDLVATVNGGAGNDTLFGGSGETHLDGGPGRDRVMGTPDRNYLHFVGARQGVMVRLHKDRVVDDGFGDSDLVKGIAGVFGTKFNDVLEGGSADGPRKIRGGQLLEGRGGDDHVTSLLGGTLRGGEGNDTLFGSAATESFEPDEGDDSMVGGGGSRDSVSFNGVTGVYVRLDLGQVLKDGWGGQDAISQIEIVRGTEFGDTLLGSDRRDMLFGGGGRDYLAGGEGNDQIEVNPKQTSATLLGGEGDDLLRIGAGFKGVADGGTGVDKVFEGLKLIEEG